MKFGDIYTNGINFWMVTSCREGCKCCGRGEHQELRPVVLDDDGNPSHFVGYYNGTVATIKPYAHFYKGAKWSE